MSEGNGSIGANFDTNLVYEGEKAQLITDVYITKKIV